MTDDKDETAKHIISLLDLDNITQEGDGIEVAATMKSLVLLLHQIILGKRENTREWLLYFMNQVSGLLQFARMAATSTKLQMIIETLKRANASFEQKEDAVSLLRDAWQLMREVLSQEEVEKVSASQIDIRQNELLTEAIIVSGPDAWEQANRILQGWSIPENEDRRVEYIVHYHDGYVDGRWLNLPLFYKMESGGGLQIDPALNLGKRIVTALEKSLDLYCEDRGSFDTARYAILTCLRRYEIGGNACKEAVTQAILTIQEGQWNPGMSYRQALYSVRNQREGSL